MLFFTIVFRYVILATNKHNNDESFAICSGGNVEYECLLTEISKSENTEDSNVFASLHFGIFNPRFYKMEHKWFLPANARIELNGKINTLKCKKEIKMLQGVFEVTGNDDVYTKIIRNSKETDRKYKLKGYHIEIDKEGKEVATDVAEVDRELTHEYFMRLNYKQKKVINVFNGEFIVDRELLDDFSFSNFYSFSSYYSTKERRFTIVGKYENNLPIRRNPYLIVPSDALYDYVVKRNVFTDKKLLENTATLKCMNGVKAEFVDDLENVFLVEEEDDRTVQQLKDLSDEKNKLEDLLNDEKGKTKILTDQISNLNTQISALNEKIKTNADEILKVQSGTDLDIQNYLRKLNDEKNQLGAELSDIKTKFNQQNIDMNVLTTKKKELDRQIVQLTNDNNNMKSGKFTEIQAQKKEIDDLKKKIKDTEEIKDTADEIYDTTTTQQPLTKQQEDLLAAALRETGLSEESTAKEMSKREKTAWALFGAYTVILVVFITVFCVWYKKYKNKNSDCNTY